MIELSDVEICIGNQSLSGISFSVPSGSYAVLMGSTGSGKTTILEAICGLRSIRQGVIRVGGRDVRRLSPAARNIGYVPQDLALFPHLNVRDHLAFALKLRGATSAAITTRINELADWLDIGKLLTRSVNGLSGGEAQRVALGRALSFRPSVLLLDEPLSALDDSTRDAALAVLSNINRRHNVTLLHVTHSHQEASALADVRFDLIRHVENGTLSVRQMKLNRG